MATTSASYSISKNGRVIADADTERQIGATFRCEGDGGGQIIGLTVTLESLVAAVGQGEGCQNRCFGVDRHIGRRRCTGIATDVGSTGGKGFQRILADCRDIGLDQCVSPVAGAVGCHAAYVAIAVAVAVAKREAHARACFSRSSELGTSAQFGGIDHLTSRRNQRGGRACSVDGN